MSGCYPSKMPSDPTTAPNRPSWLPLVDLCAVTRDSETVRTCIEVRIRHEYFQWLRFGSLSQVGDQLTRVGAYLKEGMTDEEHDSAYALSFDVSPIVLTSIRSGVVTLKAWVAGAAEDSESLHVPFESVLSVDEIEGVTCDADCGEQHIIVSRYSPSADVELWKKLRGRELRITIAPMSRRTEEE